MKKATRVINHNITEPWWGLRRNITPCFGARLVQEGNHLHYLADRASIAGTFNDADLRHLDRISGTDEADGAYAGQQRTHAPHSALHHAPRKRADM